MHLRNAARLCAALVLLPSFLFPASFASAQSTPKLEVTLKPLGAAVGDKPLPVEAIAEIDVTIRNTGSERISSVTLIAKLGVLKLAPDSRWKLNGENAVIEIGPVKPEEEITRRLEVRVAMAPLPPGRQVEVGVEVRADATLASATALIPIGDCAASFQADLTRLRIEKISEIWPTADDMRKPDTTLPRMRLFRVGMRRGDLATLDRIAAGYQARLLSDHNFFDQGVRYTVRRWSDELRAFAGQEPNPGICAVNEQMTQGIRRTIAYAAVRLEPPQKAYVRALDHIRKALNADDKDDLRSIALRTIEEAGAKIESPSPSTLKLLEQAKNDLKDKKLSEAQLDTLSLLESGAWIEAQALRSKKLSDLIDGSINGIAEAQKKNCVCAF
jgi:hypothetical protein